MNFSNVSIVAALVALSTVACASGPKVNVTYIPRSHHEHDGIATMADDTIFTDNNRPNMVVCDKPNSSTNSWTIPASADPNYQYTTRDDAEVALLEMYGTASRTAIQSCPSTPTIAEQGTIRLLPVSKLATADEINKH